MKNIMDIGLLKELDEKFAGGEYGYIDSMLVLQNGEAVFERAYEHDYVGINRGRDAGYRYYDARLFPFYKDTALHTMQSVTKSITSAVIGIAMEKGDFPDIDAPMMEYFGAVEHLDERKKAVTIGHLLTMTPGLAWDEFALPYDHPDNDCRAMEESADWIGFVLNRPMAHAAGTHFAYSSGVSQVLSAIFSKAVGVDIAAYAREHLFGPLRIGESFWQTIPQGLPDTEGGLYLRAGDLAKIGQLYLQEGRWDGRQVVPADWVRRSVGWHVEDTGLYGDGKRGRGFGYHWWLLPYRDRGIYTALGYGGQRLFVVPDLGVVAVFTGWNIYETGALHIRVFREFVLEAAEGGRRADGGGI